MLTFSYLGTIYIEICDPLSKTSHFCTFLKFQFIAFLLSIVTKEWTAKVLAFCDE